MASSEAAEVLEMGSRRHFFTIDGARYVILDVKLVSHAQ
jgi:hypothetical protein